MKKAKRLVIGCVCLMLSVTPILGASSSNVEGKQIATFSDIKESAWYYDAVDYVKTEGIMDGLSEKEFGPNKMMTRGAFILSLYQLASTPQTQVEMTFKDVSKEAKYATAIAWGVKNKIVSGYSTSEFRPDAPITREEIVTIFYNYTQYRGIETPTEGMKIREYVDEQEISKWARGPMRWGIGVGGIISGVGEEKLMPKAETTRAEAATMLMRYSEK